MGSVEHRREESNPLDTVLEAVPLPKLADKELLFAQQKRNRPDRFPDGRLPGITHAMAS